ncbi:MAG: hypothetical protein JWN25_247 [Verrucomicrobiales bacterium]|nr:hypothetical protein [Verrucomicrobiales bacterium]
MTISIYPKVRACLLAFLISPILSVGFSTTGQAADDPAFKPEHKKHWSFQPIVHTEVPSSSSRWIQTPVDAFVLQKLTGAGITPSGRADKVTLLRRAYMDLIGLPPTPEQVDAFVKDDSKSAFAKVVDQLLASPGYGERWGRHWLDLARFAESEGFKEDETRPNIWRYRDYVIKSFNDDKPYDRFVQEQIAGDELWPDDPDIQIATAFNRHYPDEHNARNLLQRRQEILNDITDTTGAVFAGLTFGCARCHNHKFDPILQSDYYRLQAFFANVRAADNIPLLKPEELKKYEERLGKWEEATKSIRDEMESIEAPKRKEIEKDLFDKYPAEIQEALKKPASDRSSMDWLMYHKARQYLDPQAYLYVAPTSAVVGKLKGEEKKRWEELNAELSKFKDLHPGKLPLGSAITDANDHAPTTAVLKGGAYDRPKEEVAPGFLKILNYGDAKITKPKQENSTGRRAALASILTDPANPLPARVMVNRIWQYHFGRGIVATASDFGLKGELPSHPELLDYLATEFVKQGWSIKSMHRLIMNSSAYQQKSEYVAEAAKVDPDDKLLWHYPRHRLEAEGIRDSALLVSGLLNQKAGGPSVFPELPSGLKPRGGWTLTKEEEERNRRSIYIFVRRNTRYPMFEAFDSPDSHESCPRRNTTTNPAQALAMMNSKLALDWAAAFAKRVEASAGTDRNKQIDTAFRMALSRKPDSEERQMVEKFMESQLVLVKERVARGEKITSGEATSLSDDSVSEAVLVDFCHMLLNANEFVYVN